MTRNDLSNLYWFWSKTQIKNKKGEVNSRSILLFETFLKTIVLAMKYNGQTKAEFSKNYKRIADILEKSDDQARQCSLAQTQAGRISDEWKAINRAMAAKEMGHEHLFEIFFRRAYDLGSVNKQEYREYQLSKLGI
jgi:hypothetical protein